jgi:hypothetical protein
MPHGNFIMGNSMKFQCVYLINDIFFVLSRSDFTLNHFVIETD